MRLSSNIPQVHSSPFRRLPFTGILYLGIVLRLVGLNRGLWLDEALSVQIIRAEPFLPAIRYNDHPPLYFILLRLWDHLWPLTAKRQPFIDEIFLRLPSVIFGILTLLLVMWWLKHCTFTPLASLLCGLLCATLPLLLRYSQEIRDYPLLVFASALGFYFSSRWAKAPQRWEMALGLSIALCIAVSTHLVGIMLLPAIFVYLAALLWQNQAHLLKPSLSNSIFMLPFIPPTLLFLGFYLFFLKKIPEQGDWWNVFSLYQLGAAGYSLLGFSALLPTKAASTPLGLSNPISMLVIGIFFLWAAFTGLAGNWRKNWPLLAAAASYWLPMLLYSLFFSSVFMDRTALPGMLPLLGFLAAQAASIPCLRWRQLSVAGLVLICSAYSASWLTFQANTPIEAWRQILQPVAQQIESNQQCPPSSLCPTLPFIIIYPDYSLPVIQYYLPELVPSNFIALPAASSLPEIQTTLERQALHADALFLVLRNDVITRPHQAFIDQLLFFLETRNSLLCPGSTAPQHPGAAQQSTTWDDLQLYTWRCPTTAVP